jgi:CheY-like chemotaxis protein
LFLDLLMPIMDGWRFRAEQRQTASADVPVVVLTAHWDAATATNDLGAVETVRKPFNLDQLLNTIQRLINR